MKASEVESELEDIFKSLEKVKVDLEALIEKANMAEDRDISDRLQNAYESESSLMFELTRNICLVEEHLDTAEARGEWE